MSFSSLSLTDAGANLLGKVVAGGELQFNRVAIGSGAWAGGVFDPEMTGLVDEEISLGVQTVVATGGGTARLTTIMLFDDLIATGFDATEIGIFAEDPDDGEILFAAATDADPSPIPANTAVPAYEHIYNFAIGIGNATSLTVEVGSSIVTATLQDLGDHAAETDVHGATSSPTPDRLIMRDAAGRAQIGAPSGAADIARKDTVDTHASVTAAHEATAAATINRIIMRDANGRAKVAAPVAADEIARKAEVDAVCGFAAGDLRPLIHTESVPAGWLECNGASVSRTTYGALFAVIGTKFGGGDGATTFGLPDLRGRFLRGWNHGSGTDPDAASRVDRGDGTSGDHVGTRQADQMQSHTHLYYHMPFSGSYGAGTGSGVTSAGASADTTGAAGSGAETRPKNTAVMWVIKY
ncbi:MAG: phage tail protein [Pseudomonadota bacterium]